MNRSTLLGAATVGLLAPLGVVYASPDPEHTEVIIVPAGDKFLRWDGQVDCTYFIQASDPNFPLEKWVWMPLIESGTGIEISHEILRTADKAFFRLWYTDEQLPTGTSLEDWDADGDGRSNSTEVAGSPQSNPLQFSSSGTGIPDGWATAHGLDPNDSTIGQLQFQSSGVTNLQAYQAAVQADPAATLEDLDGDGIQNNLDADPKDTPADLPSWSWNRSATLKRTTSGTGEHTWNLVAGIDGLLVSKDGGIFSKTTGDTALSAVRGVTEQGWVWCQDGETTHLWSNGETQELPAILGDEHESAKLLDLLDTGLGIAKIKRANETPRFALLLPVTVTDVQGEGEEDDRSLKRMQAVPTQGQEEDDETLRQRLDTCYQQQVQEQSIAWIEPHRGEEDSPDMPRLVVRVPGGSSTTRVKWRLEVDYLRGNGYRASYVEDFFWYACAIARHETFGRVRIDGKIRYYNKFYTDYQGGPIGDASVDMGWAGWAKGWPLYNLDRGRRNGVRYQNGPGGYGIYQLTWGPKHPNDAQGTGSSAFIPRSMIWNWQENVVGAVTELQVKLPAAQSLYTGLQSAYSEWPVIPNEGSLSGLEAIVVTYYNGTAGLPTVNRRIGGSKRKSCW